MFNRAIRGITDRTVPQPEVNLTKDGQEVTSDSIKTYVTVQKLKTKKDLKTGKTTSFYRQDAYAIVPTRALQDTSEGYDSTGGVKATCTSYYNTTYCGGRTYYKYTSISGKWTKYDNTISWSNSKLGYWHQGTAVDSDCTSYGGQFSGNDYTVAGGYPVSSQWYSVSVYPPYYYSNDALQDWNQANMKITLTHGSSWQFDFGNKLD